MVSTEAIEDPRTIGILNKIGYRNLGYLGALVQKWENLADEEVSFTEWVIDTAFQDSVNKFSEAAKQQCKVDAGNMRYLKRELDETKEELSESKNDIARLVSVNKDLYDKIDKLLHPHSITINSIRDILKTFNRENPAAVANGGGVTFGTGHVKINSVDKLAEFLATVHARKLGLPSNILTTFKVFVLDGKLVTLSDEYHGGVGYSFLWKKKKNTEGVVGWASAEAKKYDPRLGVDPATCVNYIDPETGKMWIYPELVDSSSETKKRDVSEASESSEKSVMSASKKMKSSEESVLSGSKKMTSDDGGSLAAGSDKNEKMKLDDGGSSDSGSDDVATSVSGSEKDEKATSDDGGSLVSISKEEGEILTA